MNLAKDLTTGKISVVGHQSHTTIRAFFFRQQRDMISVEQYQSGLSLDPRSRSLSIISLGKIVHIQKPALGREKEIIKNSRRRKGAGSFMGSKDPTS
jgi:hypothetical protein